MILDQWQKDVTNATGHIVVRSGRQCGKSTVIAVAAGDYAVENSKKKILVIASVERQAYEIFSKIYDYIYTHYRNHLKKGRQNQTKSKLVLMNGTTILCLPTGLTGAGIRGYTIDLLIADEAAFIPRAVWDAVTPMISTRIDHGARMILLSTPFGRDNFFYDCFDDPTFTKFHVSSEECPRINKDFLAQEKKRKSKVAYAQEYLGEFADGSMQWFTDELIRACQTLQRQKTIDNNKNYFLGSDIARMGDDYSTFEVMEEKEGKLYHREHYKTEKTKLNETYEEILHLNKLYDFEKIFIDNEGIGIGVYDFLMIHDDTKTKTFGVNNSLLVKQGLDEKRIRFLKEDLYTNLLSLMRQGKLKLLDDDDIFFSLRSIQFDYTSDDMGRSHLKIFARHHNDSDTAEGLIRAALAEKYKDLNPIVYSLKV